MAKLKESFDIPFQDKLLTNSGAISGPWAWFLRKVWERLYSLGVERVFQLENNQSTAADIEGLKFNKSGVSMAVFEYLVQRITTGAGASELVEAGLLIFVYNPTSENWSKIVVSEENPDDAGIVISITSGGQVQYTTTNISGTESISRIVYRVRTLAGKSSVYSSIGTR